MTDKETDVEGSITTIPDKEIFSPTCSAKIECPNLDSANSVRKAPSVKLVSIMATTNQPVISMKNFERYQNKKHTKAKLKTKLRVGKFTETRVAKAIPTKKDSIAR